MNSELFRYCPIFLIFHKIFSINSLKEKNCKLFHIFRQHLTYLQFPGINLFIFHNNVSFAFIIRPVCRNYCFLIYYFDAILKFYSIT